MACQESFNGVLRKFPRCGKEVSKKFLWYLKKFQGRLKGVSWEFSGCFKGI